MAGLKSSTPAPKTSPTSSPSHDHNRFANTPAPVGVIVSGSIILGVLFLALIARAFGHLLLLRHPYLTQNITADDPFRLSGTPPPPYEAAPSDVFELAVVNSMDIDPSTQNGTNTTEI
ncbi:hypothetical protein QCA50_006486 [Cerrena zonata]|uniref:Uncharacterized protein n=1 Tax=Cerrena zonata TaxID=2478898 RepID=A0AAW0GIX1_9APHY